MLRFLDGFFMLFGSILAPFFNVFYCFFHCLFETVLWTCFFSFLDRSLNCANPKIIEKSLVLIHYFALGAFRRRPVFEAISNKFRDRFRIDFSLIFMTFAASNSASIFASIFHGKWRPKLDWKSMCFFNKGGFGRPGGRRMSIVTTFRSRFGGVRFLMIFRSAKKTSQNWKKTEKMWLRGARGV